jgi:hypothetical protein
MLSISNVSSAATTYVSNLGQTSDGGFGSLAGLDIVASDFLTAASATMITSATLSMSNWDDITHSMTPKIYADNSGLPGTLVGTFSSFNILADPSGPGSGFFNNYTVTSTGISLAANTKYWMAVSQGEFTNLPFPVIWNTTASNTMDSGSTFSAVPTTLLKYSNDNGSSWVNATTNSTNAMFSLSGNLLAAPEPSRALLLFAGAGAMLFRRRRNLIQWASF